MLAIYVSFITVIIYSTYDELSDRTVTRVMVCHGVELGVLAGKLCVRDAQMANGVYVPTPHPHHTSSLPIL